MADFIDPFDAPSGDFIDPFDSKAAPSANPAKKQGIMAGLGSSLKRGIDSTIDYGKVSLTDNPDEIAGIVSDNLRNQPKQSAAQQKMSSEIQPYAQEAADAQGIMANIGAYGKLAGKRALQLAENPREFAGMVAENLPNSAPGIAGMIAGGVAGAATPIPFGTAIGGVVGGTAGGYKIEQGSSMFDQITKEAQARGIDTNDKAALSGMISEKYPEFLKASQLKGIGTAGTDAALNVATLGVAGMGERTLVKEARTVADLAKAGTITGEEAASTLAGIEAKNAGRNTIGQKVLRGTGVTAGEMAGESASEAVGQQLAYGKLDPLDVIDEGLLAFGQGVGMAAGRKFISPLVGATDKDTITQEIERARSFAADLNASVGGDPNAVPTLVTDFGPIQRRIDELHGVDATQMDDKARAQYEKDFEAAYGEVVGYTTDANGLEIPFTAGDYLNSQVRSADMTRDKPLAAGANDQSANRLNQLADEEAMQQPDISPAARGIAAAPVIPVVGPLSAVANAAVQSGAHQATVMQQAAAQAAQNTTPEGKAGTPAGAQKTATAPAQGPLTEVAGQAPNLVTSTPNLVTPSNAAPAKAEGASGSTGQDFIASRTDVQLSWLAEKGKGENKDLAKAELHRRQGVVETPQAKRGKDSGDVQKAIDTASKSAAEVISKGGSEDDASRAATDSLIDSMRSVAGISISNDVPAAVRAAKTINPEAAPVKSEQPQPAKGAENAQAQTEVLTKPGAVTSNAAPALTANQNTIKKADQPRAETVTAPAKAEASNLSNEMAGFTGVSDIELALRKQSRTDKQDGDIELGTGKFITLAQAVSAAKQHMDKADWSKPFQFNRVLDIAPIDWNTMVEAMKNQSGEVTDIVRDSQTANTPETYKDHLIYQSEMAGGKFMVRQRKGEKDIGELVGRGFNTVEEARAAVDAVSQSKTDTAPKAKQDKASLFKELRSKLDGLAERAMNAGDGAMSGRFRGFTIGMKEDDSNLTREWVDEVVADREKMVARLEKKVGSQSANSEPDADTRFAKNTIFTADKVAAAKSRMKAKLGTMNSGIDPELLIDGMTIAGAYIESGVRKFSDYAKAMVEDLGDGVKPYLLSFYEAARAYPGLAKNGMDSQEEAAKQHERLVANTRAATTIKPEDSNGVKNARPIQSEELPGAAASGNEGNVADGNRDSKPLDVGLAKDSQGIDSDRGVSGSPEVSGGTGNTDQAGYQHEPSVELGKERSNGDDGGAARADAAGNAESVDHVIESGDIGKGGLTKKYGDNIAAIKIIKAMEAEGRLATPEERKKIARYAGWGAIKGVFDPANKQWAKQHEELKALLTDAEFSAARKSTLNAHYTSPVAVGAMYSALERLGFTGGRVLEPSVGVGNFFGLMPAKMRAASNLHGVELDSLTSRLVAALYPKAKIAQATGFQDFDIPAEFFDVVIGNPPFGSEPIVDMQRSPYSGFSIHNYFLAKSIDKLRPGGIMPIVVSHSFLDAQDDRARKWIAERANLIGGVRLPNTAFKENAGTEVVTDILIFQKHGENDLPNKSPWLSVVDQKNTNQKTGETATHKVSQFFASNPKMVLGSPSAAGTMYSANEYTVESTGDIEPMLDAWVKTLPENVFTPIDRRSDKMIVDMEIPDGVKAGSFFVDKSGALMLRGNDVMGNKTAQPFAAKSLAVMARIKGMVGLRDLLRQQMRLERSSDATEAQIESNRSSLNKAYDDFLKKFGHVNSVTNRNAFMDDTESQLVQALEFDFDKGIGATTAEREGIEAKAPSAKKADIFQRRVMFPPSDFMKVATAKDALLASLNYRGKVDLGYMAEVYAKTPEEITKELGDVLFEDPQSGIVMSDEYLSGDVKTKLAEAKAAAMDDAKYKRNVDALEKVIPEDKKPSEISVSIGASFIPDSIYDQFIRHITGAGAGLTYIKATGQWVISYTNTPDSTLNTATYGTSHLSARELFSLSMLGRGAVVKQILRNPDGSTTTIVMEKETEAAREKQNAIKNEWQKWIWSDAERADKVAQIYNEKMNRIVERKFDGEHMTFPGMNPVITLLEHQKNGVWRGLQSFQVLYDHVVGAGKTYEMATLAMEMRRLGIARKPLFVVPNHLTLQWRSEFTKLYPGSNILAATPEDFSKDNRGRMFSKIVTGDWDAVILGHSSLKKIGLPEETERAVLQEQIDEIADAIEETKRNRGDRNIIRDMEGIKSRLEAKMKDKLASIGKRDKVLTFDELGVDALFVDEMHEFKNLSYNSTMDRNPGMGNPNGSAKAFDLFVKTRWLFDTFGEKTPYVTATGTPVSNSLVEMFNMQRYMQYPTLKREGLHVFDAWAKQFGSVENVYEVAPSGSGFRQSTRFAKFTNLPALMSLYNSFADTVTLDDLRAQEEAQGKRFPVPKITGGKPTLVVAKRSPLVAERMGVPRATLNESGEVTFGADIDLPVTVSKNPTSGKWDAKVGESHLGSLETEEDAKLRIVEKALAPNVSVAPESILGRFANLKQLTKESKGKVNALSLTGEANKAGLDYRLIDPSAPDFEGSKINLAVDNLVSIHKQWSKDKGAQLVFCDMSIPLSARASASSKESRLYVRGDDGTLAMKRGTMHAVDGFESLPFFIVAKGDKAGKRFEVYDAATGFLVGGNFASRIEAKDRTTSLIESETGRQRWLDKRLGFEEISQDLIDDYNNNNEVETEGIDFFGPEEIAGVSGSAKFSVYDDIKAKLISKGIPAKEIALIHDYSTPVAKAKLFKAVNDGDIRVLIGSTQKMGAGTNVQERLVGLHHIDAPWRPSDLEQREGRIIRRGNKLYERDPDGFEIFIGRYATEQTYDTRRWQILEHKARGIEQLRNFDGTTNEIEDIDGEAANSADMKAAASGDPLILEETKLRNEVKRLERLQDGHADEKVAMERKASSQQKYAEEYGPAELKSIRNLMAEAAKYPADKKGFSPVTISGSKFSDVETATKEIGSTFNSVRAGFPVASVTFRGQRFTFSKPYGESVKVDTDLGTLGIWSPTEAFSASGFIQRMINHVDRLASHEAHIVANIAKAKEDTVKLREQAKLPFPQDKDLEFARAEHSQVRRALMAKGPTVPDNQKAMVDAAIEKQKEKLRALGFGKAVDEMFANSGAGNIAAPSTMSPADKAIYGMAAEGKSAADILKFIATASRNPFNRQLAKLLLKTGIAPSITVGDAKGWKFNAGEGNKYSAAYNPKTDMVALFRPAAAERNMLHELVHAATLKALEGKGMAAAQMNALYQHVKKVGRSQGLHYNKATGRGVYGMADIDEFIAEAFTNPKFQDALKKIAAPQASSTLSSAWQWFVRIVKGILGLPSNYESALSAALEIGVGVMREDKALRKADNLPETAGIAERNDFVNRAIEQWQDGNLEAGTVISLGKPSAILRRFGVPDLQIQIDQGVLAKSAIEKHNISISDLKDITINIQSPLAVFKSKIGDNKIIVVTEIRHSEGNVIAALHLGAKRNRIEINDIRSIHPKRDSSIAHWVDDGLLLGLDKHKGRDWLENSAGSNSQQYPANATPDGVILYDGRLIRKAAEAAVIRYNDGLKSPKENGNVRGMADKDTVAGTQAPTSAGDGSTGSAKHPFELFDAEMKSKYGDKAYWKMSNDELEKHEALEREFKSSVAAAEKSAAKKRKRDSLANAQNDARLLTSKIRNPDGSLKLVFHGTPYQFDNFDLDEDNRNVGGIWFTDSGNYAYDMSIGDGWDSRKVGSKGRVISAYLASENPMILDVVKKAKDIAEEIGIDEPTDSEAAQELLSGADGWDHFVKATIDDAKSLGHDSLVIENFRDGRTVDSTAYVIFDTSKIVIEPNEPSASAGSDAIRYNVADEGWSITEQAKETVMRLAGRPMLDPSDPFAAENARLREQDQSLWSKAKKQLRRYLAPGGLLPQSVFSEKIKRDSEFQAVEFDVRHLIGGLEHAVKADFGMAFDKLSKEQMRPITEALAGNVPASLPEATKTAAVAMRQYIDGMSTEYLKIIQQKIDAKMLKAIESGKDSDRAQAINEIELFEKIKGNIGRYVHRSYQAFDDPKWFEKVPAHVLNDSRLYLKQGYMQAGETDAKAAQLAEVTLHEILKNGTAYDSMESFIAESKLGAKDLSVLMRRKEVPAQIRALLGEYPDARLNFTKSATKMGRLIWNTRFLDRVRDIGMGSFFFEGKDRPANATTQIAADGSEVYAPLNGLWTFPEIAQSFKDALGKEQMSDLYRAIVRANGLVKYGKAQPLDAVVYTPSGPSRMGDLRVGDMVCGINGSTSIEGIYPQGEMGVFRLTFSDGSSTEATGEHLWEVVGTNGMAQKYNGVFTTKEIASWSADALRYASIPLGVAEFDERAVPLDPYLVGAIIGDGSVMGSTVRLSTSDDEMVSLIRDRLPQGHKIERPKSWAACDYCITAATRSDSMRYGNEIMHGIEALGLRGKRSNEKFIPEIYRYNSASVRMDVMRGLLDTDGWVVRDGQPAFCTSSKQLATDFREVAESLGATVLWSEKTPKCNGKEGMLCYMLKLRVPNAPDWFRLGRKKDKATAKKKPVRRMFKSIEHVGTKPCQCIMVNDARHLYLTDRFIVTHNTVLSPTTAMRNWQSAMFFSLANGHFDLTQMKKSISAFREQVSQKATGQDLKYLRHLKQLGVVYDTPYAGEMARLMEDARMEELLSSDKGDAVRWFRKANQLAQGFYTFGDDFWKIIGFENEKAGLMKAGLSLQEAEIEAAKRIRDTYPTYSMVGRGVQWLSRFPLAGTFVSFPAEIIRTSGNMLRTVAADLKSDNPKLRELGMKRAAGMVFVSAAFYSLAALSMAMAGVGDDEDEAIRDLAPEWQKNSTFLYLGRDEKGNLRYFDMSFLDPYGYWKRPITAMLRNQPWEDSLASGLRGMLEPFLGADISAKAIFEAVSNAKESGGKVYKENDGAIDQAVDIADHLRKALQPGVVGNVERLVKAAGDVRKSSGQPYSMEDELVALVGWRATTIDPKTALYYRSFEFTDAVAEARKTLTDTLRDANDVSPEDIKDARERAKSKQEQAFKEMSRLVGAAEAAGMSKMQIVQTLRLSNISQANIASLMRGATPDVSITPQLAARAVRQANQMRGPEFAADVFDRYRQAMAK